MTAADVIEAARKYLGVPFKHQGRSPLGLDCVGLVILVCRTLGLRPGRPAPQDYGRMPTAALLAQVRKHCIELEAPEPGCMILIRFPRELLCQHAALCTGQNLIHAYSTSRKVVEHGYRMHWVKWTHSYWWLQGVQRG